MAQEVRFSGSQDSGRRESPSLADIQSLNALKELIRSRRYLDALELSQKIGIPLIAGGSGEGEGEGSPTEGDPVDPQAGETQEGDPQAGESEGDPGEEMISLAEAKKLRSEYSGLRRRNKELEGRLNEIEDGKLDELERAQKERDRIRGEYDSLVSSLKAERVSAQVLEASAKAGAIEPGAIAKLVDMDSVEFDDERNPTNTSELVSEIKRAHPRLFQAAQGTGGGGERDEDRNNVEPSSSIDRMARGYARNANK